MNKQPQRASAAASFCLIAAATGRRADLLVCGYSSSKQRRGDRARKVSATQADCGCIFYCSAAVMPLGYLLACGHSSSKQRRGDGLQKCGHSPTVLGFLSCILSLLRRRDEATRHKRSFIYYGRIQWLIRLLQRCRNARRQVKQNGSWIDNYMELVKRPSYQNTTDIRPSS